MKYADVSVAYPIAGTFTYSIPGEMDLLPGMRVRAPFGKSDVTAFVRRVHETRPESFELKEIRQRIDEEPIFDSRLLDLADFTAEQYLCTPGEVLGMALPSGRKPSGRFRNPCGESRGRVITLTAEQEEVCRDITASAATGPFFHLLFGITGSGKTEVYMETARDVIRRGRSVIYLVPEISLSSQIFQRLYDVFGADLVLYHSRLTPNQRLHHWKKFYSGEAKIAVGTRSAVFLQCPSLGLMVIDEEHDGSYKEHSTPRYNARRLAFHRCREERALLLMGSATPSVESLYAAERGTMKLHRLMGRYGEATLPAVEIVRISPRKPSEMLSPLLKLHTKKAIEKGEQAIFLLNKRGFAPILVCDACGAVAECPHCSISLNYHRDGRLLCHYCGYSRATPEACLSCGSEELVKLGSGTQRVEETILGTYREARVFRLDQDTSGRKGTVFDLIEKMGKGEIDILLGTQMVAKGFDFSRVTVVGVILADIGLNLPDFRSSERIFSLLIQAAGRCGRGETPGRVIVQTFDEDQPILRFLQSHDYYGFYRYELSMRKALGYPPFSRIARLLVRGKKEEKVAEQASRLKAALDAELNKGGERVTVLGPSPAPLARIAGNYRHHVILKSSDGEALRRVIAAVRASVTSRDVYLEIDIDPNDML